MKVAACLFVRNEVSDIDCWLAWYHLLGFDACIVYDDYSTDGTWERIEAAARVQDIRLFRAVGDRSTTHQPRQNSCYLLAIEQFRDEFDWIGFFDSDEYLRLMDSSSIKEFLGRFPAGGAVSINWCCYGSSGHALKPDSLPIEAYTWHSTNALPINRHVKTILHLASWQGKYINQHCFDVPAEKSVDPSGTPIRWSSTPGITESPPDWSVAKVMHYQCRSMEHFINRLKRAPKLPRTTRTWNVYDTNDIEDTGPLLFAPALKEQIARYGLSGSAAPADPVVPTGVKEFDAEPPKARKQDHGLIIDVGVAEGNDSAFYLAKGFRVIAIEADPQACIALRKRFHQEVTGGQLKVLNFAAGADFGSKIDIFVHSDHQGLSGISKRAEVSDKYTRFEIPSIDWKTLLAQEGLPRYLKIDVEGSEAPFIESMLSSIHHPEFVSVECYSFLPIEMFFQMGYTRFKLINQNPEGGFRLPDRQLEGDSIIWNKFNHSSGPFGLDLFQDGIWFNFAEVRTAWEAAKTIMNKTWFDCHAWKPN